MRVDFFKIVHLQKILHFEKFRDNQIPDYVPHSIYSAMHNCTDLELSTLTDLLTDYAAPETPSIRRKATVRIKNSTSTAVSINIYAPKWAQIQMENHHMVILNIPKKEANVNLFQLRINILLIFNNSLSTFLVIMTRALLVTKHQIDVKLFNITYAPYNLLYVKTEQKQICPPEIGIYIKGIVKLYKSGPFIILNLQ